MGGMYLMWEVLYLNQSVGTYCKIKEFRGRGKNPVVSCGETHEIYGIPFKVQVHAPLTSPAYQGRMILGSGVLEIRSMKETHLSSLPAPNPLSESAATKLCAPKRCIQSAHQRRR